MLGKQWLNRYSQVDMHGSFIDRSRERQRKMDGMASWGFHLVMESLPIMFQVAPLFLGCALSKYLFTIDNTVAWVTVCFTTVGFLFFVFIIIAATISYNCPFQNPSPSSFASRFALITNTPNTSRDLGSGFDVYSLG